MHTLFTLPRGLTRAEVEGTLGPLATFEWIASQQELRCVLPDLGPFPEVFCSFKDSGLTGCTLMTHRDGEFALMEALDLELRSFLSDIELIDDRARRWSLAEHQYLLDPRRDRVKSTSMRIFKVASFGPVRAGTGTLSFAVVRIARSGLPRYAIKVEWTAALARVAPVVVPREVPTRTAAVVVPRAVPAQTAVPPPKGSTEPWQQPDLPRSQAPQLAAPRVAAAAALPEPPVLMITAAVPQRVCYSDWAGSREIAAVLPLGHSEVLTSRRWADYQGGLSLRWPVSGGVVLVLVRGQGDRSSADTSSQLAFDTIVQAVRAVPFPESSAARGERLQAVLDAANEAFINHGSLGASAVVALVTAGQLEVAHVGDSRLWHLSASKLDAQGLHQVTQLTTDHTLAEDYRQALGDSMTAAQLEALPHALTRALGAKCQASLAACALGAGDRILLTTSRLHSQIPRQELSRMLRQQGETSVYLLAALRQAVQDDDDGYACLAADIYQDFS